MLRANHRFALAGTAEGLGWRALGGTVMVLLFVVHAPLWALAAAGGAIPAFLGLSALVVVRVARLPYHLRPGLVSRADLRAFLGVSGYMFFISSSDVLINSLDRTVLAAFRPAATVGLYEGAIRLNNLVRAFTGSLLVALPVSSRLAAEGDRSASVTSLCGEHATCSRRLSHRPSHSWSWPIHSSAAWLGPKFSAAGPAVAIFLVWWLVAPSSSVANTVNMVVDSRFNAPGAVSWTIAIVNLAARWC